MTVSAKWDGPLTVWIVNYESSQYVASCLNSLQQVGVDQVAILDNGSSSQDYDALTIAARRFPGTTVYRSQKNLGFGGGHNRLSELTPRREHETIWILNPDTKVTEGSVERLRDALQARVADIVSPLILNSRNGVRRIWFSGGHIDAARGVVEDSQLGRDLRALDSAPPVLATEFVTGAAPMMLRSTFDDLRGFDGDLFLYWEDVDLSLRARARNLSSAVLTSATIEHYEGGSSRQRRGTRALAYFYMSRNRIWVCRRMGTRGIGIVLGPGLIPTIRFIAYALFREGGGRGPRLFAILRGFSAGLRIRPTKGS